MGALNRAGDLMKFVQVRHEEMAAFMACAHSRWQVLEARAMNSADPINPQRLFWELSPLLPDNCILSSDSGSSANWFARDLKIRRGMMASLSGNLATMCPGVPYAIAAKFCFPSRVAIALVGDGAMQMLGNNGLITISKYWKEWSDPRLVILVLNNRDLNQVTWEQRVMEGDPKFEASQEIPGFPFARYAELLGLRGICVNKAEQIRQAWDAAFSSDRPVVVEAYTGNKPSNWHRHFPSLKWPGLKSRFPPMILKDCDCSATTRPQAWMLPLANMDMS
jgi:pyruvate dehydrogenase (quinone)